MLVYNADVYACCIICKSSSVYQTPHFSKVAIEVFLIFLVTIQGFSLHHPLFFFFFYLPCKAIAQRDHEPLYQFWVWYLGVIRHVGHQLAKKQGPLWDAHLFSVLGRAQSQRAAGMNGMSMRRPSWKDKGGRQHQDTVCPQHSCSPLLF